MNYERIHFVYYVYNTVVVLFVLLGLGKFFCVRRLYDLYDDINDSCGNTLPGWMCLATVFSIFSYLCLYWDWKLGIIISVMVMTIASLCMGLIVIVFIIRYIFECLRDYHDMIKSKKNL